MFEIFDLSKMFCNPNKAKRSGNSHLSSIFPKGFTLIELLIGVALFVFVLSALGVFISTLTATEFHALAMQKLADNTRTALEIMGKEMRLARRGDGACLDATKSFEVSNPGPDTGSSITFLDFSNRCIAYNLDSASKRITKTIGSSPAQTFLGGNIDVTKLSFQAISGVNTQSRVIIAIGVQTKDPTVESKFLDIFVQTMVSQREINIQ